MRAGRGRNEYIFQVFAGFAERAIISEHDVISFPALDAFGEAHTAKGRLHNRLENAHIDIAPSEFAALGTVVAGKFDGASGTLKKRERKTGLMGELLADAGARSYAKRRFTAVQERQRGPGLSTLKQKRKALARRKKGR